MSPMGDTYFMVYKVRQTEVFKKWLKGIKDPLAKASILIRIANAENGNLGDHKSVGGGVSEMRIDKGKGYRAYFTLRNGELVLLLCGGTKSNKKAQQADVKKAKDILKEL